jgi:hypothetical protein
MALQIRRGPNAQRATTLLQTGEVVWTTDTKKLYVGDGVTTGGVNILANIAGTGFVWNPSTEQLDLASSTITGINADNVAETNGVVPRLWYRSSLGKTHASEIFTTVAGAAHSGITFSWDDVNQKLTATVTGENAQDAAAALFTAGTHSGISFTYGLTEDAANRIDATVSDEYIQDAAAAMFAAGVHSGIAFTYSDNLNAMSAAVSYPAVGGNLGSNLVLNTFNISGTGNISNTGTMTATGNISTSGGSISATNSVSAGTTISATQGLGANLPLNSFNINGTGNINITGAITATGIVTAGSSITSSISAPNGGSPITCLTLNNNSVTFGTNPTPLGLTVVGTKDAAVTISSVSSGFLDGGGLVQFNISSGTHAAPTKIAAQGLTGGFAFNGYNGTAYKSGAAILPQVVLGTDTTGANFIKTDLIFATSDGVGNIDIALIARNDKVAESPCFKATPFASPTARTTAIPVPEAGMVTYITSTNKLQVYNGTVWVDLH